MPHLTSADKTFSHPASRATHGKSARGGVCPVYFFSIQAGLSRAQVVRCAYEGGGAVLEFAQVRGQSSQIRCRAGSNAWTPWQPFATRLEIPLEARPTHFQLQSRLGVVSAVYPIE